MELLLSFQTPDSPKSEYHEAPQFKMIALGEIDPHGYQKRNKANTSDNYDFKKVLRVSMQFWTQLPVERDCV